MNTTIIQAAGGLIFNKDNRLLMIYRNGFWDLPKGKLDEGETLEQCAVREVEEETGLKNIMLGKLIGITFHDYFNKWSNSDVTKETHWYEMNIAEEQPLVPQTEEDIEKIEWVTKEEALTYMDKSYKNIVEIIQKSGFVS